MILVDPKLDDARRLWALEALCDPLTIDVLGRLHLSRRWRCLELGAGRGSIARWLATQCLHGSVLATDTDLSLMTDIHEPNLEVRRHEIVDGPELPPKSFDLIHGRALFVHLPDRKAAVRRAANWLVPGGWLVIEEPALFPVDSVADSTMRAALVAFERLMADRLGSDFRWPRQLPQALRAAGLVDVDMIAALAVTSDGGAVNEFWRTNLVGLSAELIDAKLIAPNTLREAVDILADPDYRELTLAFICAWGRAPRS